MTKWVGFRNEAIYSDLCSLRYHASLDDLTLIVQKLRKGTVLAKLDLEKAYRMVPVHPDDHSLLGIRLGTNFYVDIVLPFGLRSAPKIY